MQPDPAILGLIALGSYLAGLLLLFLPVPCEHRATGECEPCKAKREYQRRLDEAEQHMKTHRFYGDDLCPICRQRRDRDGRP